MPALSPTMTEGKLANWHVKEGDAVSSGDVIAEIETDKATMEIEAVDEGTVGRILVSEGTEGIAVNTPIALILAEGEDAGALEGTAAPPAPAQPTPATTATEKPAPVPSKPSPALAPNAQSLAGRERLFASPLARRMAVQAGIDLAAIRGSGPHGRIVKRDIDVALTGGVAPTPTVTPAPVPATASVAAGEPTFREEPHTSMRKTIARRLTEAKQKQPHFYLTIDCRIDELLRVRKELNARAPEGEGAYKLSVNDFVIKAAALALRRVPKANASWTDEAARYYETADVSVAVAVPSGLITPVLRGAEAKGLVEVSDEMKALAQKARDGKLMPEEYQGGTFTISNLGMYGVREFAAVINPPQGAILAIGAGEQRPVVVDGALAIATIMTCTLSVDHRIIDGAVAAEFLAAFKELVEDPLAMLL